MKRLVDTLRWLAFSIALLIVLGALACVVIEQSGVLSGFLRDRFQARLGRFGSTLAIGDARLSWFGRHLELEKVSLGEGGSLVRFDLLRVEFDLVGPHGTRISRLIVEGGRITASPELIEAADALVESLGPAAPLDLDDRSPSPEIRLYGVAVDFPHPLLGMLPLGYVHAWGSKDSQGRARGGGRILPAISTPGSTGGLHLEVLETEEQRYEIEVWGSDIEVLAQNFPDDERLRELARWSPNGQVSLQAEIDLRLGQTPHVSALLRGRVRDGSFVFPGQNEGPDDVELDFLLRLAPLAGEDWNAPGAWHGHAVARAAWRGAKLEGGALLGGLAGEGLRARSWLTARDLALEHSQWKVFEELPGFAESHGAFDPRGRGDLVLGLEFPRAGAPALGGWFEPRGSCGFAFHGWSEGGGERIGFPLAVDAVEGRILLTHAPTRRAPLLIALSNLRGLAITDGERIPARAEGLVASPSERGLRPRLALEVHSPGLTLGPDLHRALDGLPFLRFVWPEFSPSQGTAAADLRWHDDGATPGPSVSVDVALAASRNSWSELPLDLTEVRGRLRARLDARGALGIGLRLEGRHPGGERVALQGRVQDDPTLVELPPGLRAIQDLELQADDVPLKGAVRDALAAKWPELGGALDQFGPAGKVGLSLSAVRASPGARQHLAIEVSARDAVVFPTAFPMRADRVRGRVLVGVRQGQTAADTQVETRIAPLVGEWPSEMRVALEAEFPADSPGRLSLSGARLNPRNSSLVGTLNAISDESGQGGLDLSALAIEGRLDFDGEIELRADGRPPQSRYRFFLRDNDLTLEGELGFKLSALRGELVQEGKALSGAALDARIGSTPIKLNEARLEERGQGDIVFRARLDARDLPLDRKHMRFLLEDETIRVLEEQLAWRGSIDVVDARILYRGKSAGAGRVEFSGRVVPHRVMLDLGLPVEIHSADAFVHELVYERGRVRAWGEVRELEGAVAGRKLERARMLVTFVEPHLSVLDLGGRLEGGPISDLGGSEGGAGPAFSIDLEAPFAFELGVRLREVQVEGLLRGLFESDFANTGTLSGDLRLSGSLERLTGVDGQGSIDLENSRLWSIPVVRDLFSQLGFDSTAVFERMRCRFGVQGGVVDMDSLQVTSPLLQLVGEGTLDFDGSLRHDLEVRYSLVDRLGPLQRLLYWIQNNLLRVEVRGDMQRPRVVLKGLMSFLQKSRAEGRDLPLPSFTPIPARF